MTAPLLLVMLQQDTQPWWLGLLAILFLVVFAAGGYLLWYRRRRLDRAEEAEDEDGPLPPLIFPPRPVTPGSDRSATFPDERDPPAQPPARTENADRPAHADEADDADSADRPPHADEADSADSADRPGATEGEAERALTSESIRIAPTPIRFSLAAERAAAQDGAEITPTESEAASHSPIHPPIHSPVSAGNVRFHRPTDGTLQLLPGRLEVLDESAGMHEIRFVRPAGREPVITFGRTAGEPLAHIQLDAPTVSRLHARMHFSDGEWRIVNLSHTNPVVVNGVRLNGDSPSDGTLLEDGDLVEMGEISFRFRMP